MTRRQMPIDDQLVADQASKKAPAADTGAAPDHEPMRKAIKVRVKNRAAIPTEVMADASRREMVIGGIQAWQNFSAMNCKYLGDLPWDDDAIEQLSRKQLIKFSRELGKFASELGLAFGALLLEHADLKEVGEEIAEQSRSAGRARAELDPRVLAMRRIKERWEEMHSGATPFRKDAVFAREMLKAFPILTTDASIKNAISRWRKTALGGR